MYGIRHRLKTTPGFAPAGAGGKSDKIRNFSGFAGKGWENTAIIFTFVRFCQT
jgi:hypothetical protein